MLEIRRNEEHDTFINAVTHELKTPIASIRLYLETLQSRSLSDEQRREFYDVMLADADRLQHTVDQVLKAGAVRAEAEGDRTRAGRHVGAGARMRRPRARAASPAVECHRARVARRADR